MTTTMTDDRRRRPDDFLTVRHLRIAGANARSAGGSPTPRPPCTARRPHPARPIRRVERARRRWFAATIRHSPSGWPGVADHFGVDPDDPTYARLARHLRPARRLLGRLLSRAGTKDGHGLLSRNFDFPTATSPRSSASRRSPANDRWRPTRG